MFIRDVMTTNVVTIPSSTSLADARRIMDAHRIRRLPVVDKGKLIGVVSRDTLDRAGPSKLTTFSIHELSYLLAKITVKEVMKTQVVTVSPDATIEESVTLAQSRQVGALLVVEAGRVVGIATTNDIFYKIVNPILGIDQPGIRLSIHKWDGIASWGWANQGMPMWRLVLSGNAVGVRCPLLPPPCSPAGFPFYRLPFG